MMADYNSILSGEQIDDTVSSILSSNGILRSNGGMISTAQPGVDYIDPKYMMKIASGSFTPKLVSDTGVDPTVQYIEGQMGYYYRIGALVFTNFVMRGRITNAGTGYAAIGGFPFVGDAQGFTFGITTFSLPVCSELISSDVAGYIIRFVPSLGIARINNANGKNPVKFMVSGTYNFEVIGSIFYIANDGNSYQ